MMKRFLCLLLLISGCSSPVEDSGVDESVDEYKMQFDSYYRSTHNDTAYISVRYLERDNTVEKMYWDCTRNDIEYACSTSLDTAWQLCDEIAYTFNNIFVFAVSCTCTITVIAVDDAGCRDTAQFSTGMVFDWEEIYTREAEQLAHTIDTLSYGIQTRTVAEIETLRVLQEQLDSIRQYLPDPLLYPLEQPYHGNPWIDVSHESGDYPGGILCTLALKNYDWGDPSGILYGSNDGRIWAYPPSPVQLYRSELVLYGSMSFVVPDDGKTYGVADPDWFAVNQNGKVYMRDEAVPVGDTLYYPGFYWRIHAAAYWMPGNSKVGGSDRTFEFDTRGSREKVGGDLYDLYMQYYGCSPSMKPVGGLSSFDAENKIRLLIGHKSIN